MTIVLEMGNGLVEFGEVNASVAPRVACQEIARPKHFCALLLALSTTRSAAVGDKTPARDLAMISWP